MASTTAFIIAELTGSERKKSTNVLKGLKRHFPHLFLHIAQLYLFPMCAECIILMLYVLNLGHIGKFWFT